MTSRHRATPPAPVHRDPGPVRRRARPAAPGASSDRARARARLSARPAARPPALLPPLLPLLLPVLLLASLAGPLLACAREGDGRHEPALALDGLPPDVLAAVEVVQGLQAAMIGIMQAGPELGYAGRYAAIEAVARVSFDIPAMARASYGPGYSALDASQKRTWLEVFERFHVSSLADVRDAYAGQSYRLLGYAAPGPGVVVVESKLDYPNRAVDLYIDYRLRRTGEGWRIVDVHSPPSVSEVAMRRAEYRTVLERHGFDGLVEEMEARIARRERP